MKRALLLIAGVTLASLACGQVPSPSLSGKDAVQGEPKPGGTLTTHVSGDLFDFDISYNGKSHPNDAAQEFAYESLLGFKAGPDAGYNEATVIPELAERWEVSPDARAFTFSLRKGVTFASLPPVNGRELTAADAKWSFEYWSRSGHFQGLKLPPAFYGWAFADMEKVETPDSHTVVVRFKEPFAPFLKYSASNAAGIVPKEIYEQDGNLQNTIVGTGPFQLDAAASQKGTRWVWRNNPGYWQSGRPHLAEVRWFVLPNDATAVAAFQTKQLDILGGAFEHRKADEIEKDSPGAVRYEFETGHPWVFYMQQEKPPLNDPRIRRAVSLATDRDEFIRTFNGGRGSWLMPGVFAEYFTPEERRHFQPYDPAAARRLVTEAGYPNGVDLEFLYTPTYGDEYVSKMQLLGAQLKKGGINLTFKAIPDRGVYVVDRRAKKYSITFGSGASIRWDTNSNLNDFHPDSRSNYSGVNDSQLTALINAQRAEPDLAKRRDLIRQAALRIVEMGHSVGMYSEISNIFWHPYVKNYAPNWNITGWPLVHTWLDK